MLFHSTLLEVVHHHVLQEPLVITEHVILTDLQEQPLTIQTLLVFLIPFHVVQGTTFQETRVYRFHVVQDITFQEIPVYRILTQTHSQVFQLLERFQ